MKLKATCNIVGIHQDRDVRRGEIFESRDDAHGREMIKSGIAVPPDQEIDSIDIQEQQPSDQEKILAAISACETPDALLEIMPENEPDEVIVNAFVAKMTELEAKA